LVVETPPLLRNGQPLRPGSILVRVRNLGDSADSATIRLRVRGGRLGDTESFVATLEPFAAAEQRFTVWAEADKVHLEVARDGVGGVLAVLAVDVADDALTAWPNALNVSALQPGAGRLETLDRVPPANLLQGQRHAVDPHSHFCDLHERLQKVGEEDAVVWFGCRICCPEPMRVAVRLGYDGPVKLFVDGAAVFHDPDGTNPAKPDRAAPEVALTAGEHELALALGANQGRAWGVFLRLQRLDPAGVGLPVLPEIRV